MIYSHVAGTVWLHFMWIWNGVTKLLIKSHFMFYASNNANLFMWENFTWIMWDLQKCIPSIKCNCTVMWLLVISNILTNFDISFTSDFMCEFLYAYKVFACPSKICLIILWLNPYSTKIKSISIKRSSADC